MTFLFFVIVFSEVKCPNFLCMHLKGVHTLLFLVIPYFNNSIHARWCNLKAWIKPSNFYQCWIMALKRGHTFPVGKVPNLQGFVTASWNNKLLGGCKLYIPHSFFVSRKSGLEVKTTCFPYFYGLILRRSCNKLVIGRYSHGVDVFLMSHNCHLSWFDRHKLILLLRYLPDFKCVILTHWCEK